MYYLDYCNISTSENENAKGHISRESIVYEMAHQVRDLRTQSDSETVNTDAKIPLKSSI